MSKKRFIWVLVACIMVLSLLLTSAACKAPAAEKEVKPGAEMPKFLLITGGGTSMTSPSAVAAQLVLGALQDKYPDLGVRHLLGGGMVAGTNMLLEKTVDLAISIAPTTYETYQGLGSWKGKPAADLRVIATFELPYKLVFWVKPDSPIKSLKDFANKRIAVGAKGGATQTWVEAILKNVHGFDYAAINKAGGVVQYTSYEESLELLTTGELDVGCTSTFHPYGPAEAIIAQHPLRPVGFTPEEVAWAEKNLPGLVGIDFPANVYKGQVGEKVTGLTGFYQIMVLKDMPDAYVYNILSAVFEDKGRRWEEVPAWKGADWVGNGLIFPAAPVHPGAEKYWKEVYGVNIGKRLWELKPGQ